MFLTAAKGRIEAVDAVVADARAVLGDVERAARHVLGAPDDHAARRLGFVDDLMAEIATGERTLAGAETRIADHRAAIERLLQGFRLR